jgi:hypothetical protein
MLIAGPQLHLGLWVGLLQSLYEATGRFFLKARWRGSIGLGMAWTQYPAARAQPHEILPASLRMHLTAGVHPRSSGLRIAAGPQAAIGSTRIQVVLQLLLLFC